MIISIVLLPVAIIIFIVYLYWRFRYFFRDPIRNIPVGDSLVLSPADGTVVYVHPIEKETIPISIKNKNEIHLREMLRNTDYKNAPYQIVGIFMHPTSVHINRSPIKGIIKQIVYTQNKNLPMTKMWWKVLLKISPYEKGSPHVTENTRNVIEIVGRITTFVVQIADIYVSKIACYVKEGESVNSGQKIGAILIGSQVDLLLPINVNIRVKKGDSVKAGESIIGDIK